MKKKLVGWNKFFSQKKQQWYLQAHCVTPVTSYDREFHGMHKVETIFIPEELWPLFEKEPDKFVNKDVIFDYYLDGRFQRLVDVRLA